MRIAIFITMLALSAPAIAQQGSPLIDYPGYEELVRDVRPMRAKRLLGLAEFQERAAEPGVLLLDARSAQAFAEGHIEGAVNLPFTDFTPESLTTLIGQDRNRPILIYCNNNFTDNRRPVATKARPLALNIQTFVNLVGYGYTNVWELADAVSMDDAAVGWVSGQPTT